MNLCKQTKVWYFNAYQFICHSGMPFQFDSHTLHKKLRLSNHNYTVYREESRGKKDSLISSYSNVSMYGVTGNVAIDNGRHYWEVSIRLLFMYLSLKFCFVFVVTSWCYNIATGQLGSMKPCTCIITSMVFAEIATEFYTVHDWCHWSSFLQNRMLWAYIYFCFFLIR